jgi:chemotaxis protein methyltransferase CheR
MALTNTFDDLPALDEGSFLRIADLVYRHTGIRIARGKVYFLFGRLGRLYRSLRCSPWGELASRLEGAPPELIETFVQSVVTAETRFFRDGFPFRALSEKIAPEIAGDRQPPAPLRIWSAGCSTGQEPYSVVMALWRGIQEGRLDVEVLATDLSRGALERARRGVYEQFDLGRGLPPDARSQFFEDLGDGTARVREEVRGLVRFERFNLCAEAPAKGSFHVVLCRNVAIYFDRTAKEDLCQKLADALVPGGYLILGAAETLLPAAQGFDTMYFERCLLFRKTCEVPDGPKANRDGTTGPKGLPAKSGPGL